MKKSMVSAISLMAIFYFFSTITLAQSPDFAQTESSNPTGSYAEVQANFQDRLHLSRNPDDVNSVRTQSLAAFITGPLKKFNLTSYIFVQNGSLGGWAEFLILPQFTFEGEKGGLLSVSAGMGIETLTMSPRLATSIFFQKKQWSTFFSYEQGTNEIRNNYYLFFSEYAFSNGISIGLHSESKVCHGFRISSSDGGKITFWGVIGATKLGPSMLFAVRRNF